MDKDAILKILDATPLNPPLGDLRNIFDVSKPLAIDTETTGLYRGIRLVQMFQSHWPTPMVFDVRDCNLKDIFDVVKDGTWIIHNAPFDLQCFLADLNHSKCEVADFEDTLLLAKLVWADKEIGFSLDDCFAYILGFDVYDFVLNHYTDGTKRMTKSILQKSFLHTKTRDGSKIDVTNLQKTYSALDVLFLPKLYETTKSLVDENESYKWLYALDKSFIRYALIWQQRGVPLNQKFLAEEKARLSKELVDTEAYIKTDVLKDESINIWSPLQIKKKCGIDSTSREALGILSFGEDKFLADVASNLLKARRIKKRLTYVEEYEGCERIRGYFACSASTGRARVSGSEIKGEVNLAQFPRSLHTAIDAGDGYFAYADFSNLEVRCAAVISKCPDLKRILNGGLDMHTYSAQNIFKKENVTPEERHIGKIANFAALYMCGPKRFKAVVKEQSGVDRTLEECAKMLDGWRNAYRGIKEWHNSILREVFKDSQYKTMAAMGRQNLTPVIRWTPMGRMQWSRIYNETCGGQSQGFGAEVAKYTLHILSKEYPQLNLILFMHDSYVVECPTFEEAREAANILASVMVRSWDTLTHYLGIDDLYMPIDAEVVKCLDGEKYWIVEADGRGNIVEKEGEAYKNIKKEDI